MVDFIKKLKILTNQIDDLKTKPKGNPEFSVWHNAVMRTLKEIFGEDDDRVKQFDDVSFSLHMFSSVTPESAFQEAYLGGLDQSQLLLQDFLSEIPDQSIDSSPKQKSTMDDDIFIVHGHDNEAKLETARFIEKLNLNAVILHERPNKGSTNISSDFSGVLYIPMDDAGKWKYDLGNEMKEVGFRIDLNTIS